MRALQAPCATAVKQGAPQCSGQHTIKGARIVVSDDIVSIPTSNGSTTSTSSQAVLQVQVPVPKASQTWATPELFV